MDKDGYNDTQEAYERGFIDGMQKQMQSSVDKAVNSMTRTWVGLTDEEMRELHESREAAVRAEREAIAQSLDKQADLAADDIDRQWAMEMAKAVRSRSNK